VFECDLKVMYVIVFTIAGLIYYSWFGGADFAARAPVTGLGADGSMSQYSFVGRLLFGYQFMIGVPRQVIH
jgi:hypothetical protein